jgi:glutathione S-transferase
METNANPAAETMRLYSAWYCPFAQRAWMTLLHKGMPFEYIEVDPYQTTDWWVTTSRGLGKVPVLVVSARQGAEAITVVDSTRVVEYLEERAPDVAPLFPPDPEARARPAFGSTTSTRASSPTSTASWARTNHGMNATMPGRR